MAKLWLDGRVKANLQESVPLIGAPTAWAAGYTGKGVKVAVLDTGIDVGHPDFAGLVDGTASFVPGEAVTDVKGHGTHVAGTIVGSGAANQGVAPGADLYVGKVLGGAEGSGRDSWIMAGMQWAAESGAWTGAQLKEHLMSTVKGLDGGYSPYEVGTGRLDVAAAVHSTVRGTGSLSFGNYT
ncbi:S8 family serine peptidase [Streptomyces sp. NPDC090036]|uniref:S8 family serine peptidase n=1 Tax=Streptomyces sp. NPDC090036 TaxID=3365926 RepID=UPI00382C8C7E